MDKCIGMLEFDIVGNLLCRSIKTNWNKNNFMGISKQQVAKSFSRSASQFEKHAFFHKEIAERLLERLELMNSKPKAILDAGCGTGVCTRALKNKFPKSNIVGIDIAEGMIEEALKKQSFFKKNEYQVADIESLPFSSGSFELVFSNLALLWLENPEVGLAELNRVLKPGGLLIFSTLGPGSLIELRESWQRIDSNIHINHFADMQVMGDAVHKSGFENTVIDRDLLTLKYKTLTGMMRDIKLSGAHNMHESRSKGLLGRSAFEKLVKYYEGERLDDGGLPATFEVVYGHAWKKMESVEDYHTYRVDVN